MLQPRCARCHDGNGTGNAARENLPEIPDFSSHKWQVSRTDAQLLASILDGKGNHMPPYRGKVNEREARDLVAQIRDLDPAPAARPPDSPPDDFERRFRALQEELGELKKQFREMSAPQHKP
jgi:mono/diheme cytochrome c family protein